jgi:hypothetical protein
VSATLYVLPHILKCAGTTIRFHFRDVLGPPAAVEVYSRKERARWLHPERVPQAERDQLRLICGHRVPQRVRRGFAGRTIREGVLIRDPVSFTVSMYNFLLTRPLNDSGIPPGTPFETWYRGYKRNRMTLFLLRTYFEFSELDLLLTPARRKLAYVDQRLSEFWFVGTQSDCNELIGVIAADLGVSGTVVSRNTAKPDALKPADLPPSLATRILEDNALDAELFERWGRRRQPAAAVPPLEMGAIGRR